MQAIHPGDASLANLAGIRAADCTGDSIDQDLCGKFLLPANNGSRAQNAQASKGAARHPRNDALDDSSSGSPSASVTGAGTPAHGTIAGQGKPLEEILADITDPDWTIRWHAVNALGRQQEPGAIPYLTHVALHDENNHPRWRALWAIRAIDVFGQSSIPVFLHALTDPDAQVVRNAAVALAYFGRSEAKLPLMRGLDDADPFRRWEVIFSLRNISDRSLVPAILPMLDIEREPDARVRGEAALLLGQLRDPMAIRALKAAAGDPSPAVRWRAARASNGAGKPVHPQGGSFLAGGRPDTKCSQEVMSNE